MARQDGPSRNGLLTSIIFGLGFGLISAVILNFTPVAVCLLTVLGSTIGLYATPKDKSVPKSFAPRLREITGTLSEELRRELETYSNLVEFYRRETTVPKEIRFALDSILKNAQELFARVNVKLDTQGGRMVALNYSDIFSKLNRALGKDYYYDILRNRNLWDSADQRIAAIEKAVQATDRQLVQNIRQINAAQDIDYQVVLQSLTAMEDSRILGK